MSRPTPRQAPEHSGPRLSLIEYDEPHRCCACGERPSAGLTWTIDWPVIMTSCTVSRVALGHGRVEEFCSAACCRSSYPELVAAVEAEQAAWREIAPMPVLTVTRRDDRIRMTWHPDPMRDERAREWDAMTNESKNYNRR